MRDRVIVGLAPFDVSAQPIVRHLGEQGYLDSDGGLLFVGLEADRRFGRRHFTELTAVFTGPPEFTVLHGRTEFWPRTQLSDSEPVRFVNING
ncbi:hypothetical protein [Micromonospora radicis]|uniref:hypothetical protein n=1 Tax=Micromonospora radicis TaxID=1894971 RepID=UPI001F2282BA|nr:hypothetical protein [Micromonospora radicis]